MGWQETQVKTEKIKFIGDYLKGEFSMTELCIRYQISRKTGYKLINRYSEEGESALEERSRARHTHPNGTADDVVEKLLSVKHRYPHFGPATIQAKLLQESPELSWPAISTIGDILKRHGLVKPRKRRRKVPAHSHPFIDCNSPNRVRSADFKGQFKLGNGEYCYPLTVSDNYSRFLLGCQGLLRPTLKDSLAVFERLFREFGLPDAMKTDNGQPFAGHGTAGLTALSIWWIKLGIWPERIEAGHPEQNGRHERMHRTLKEQTIRPAQQTLKEQQACFDKLIRHYNEERPHQGIDKQYPSQVYQASSRAYPSRLPELVYPDEFEVRRVRISGEMKWKGKRYFLSQLLHGEPIGLQLLDEERALLYFGQLKLGIIDARLDKIKRF